MSSLNKYTDEELIKTYKECNYSLSAIDKKFSLSKNTSLREFRKRGIDFNKLLQDYKTKLLNSYEESPNLCKHCGKPLPWKKRLNRFCSNSCSVSENNIGIVRNPNGAAKFYNLSKKQNYQEKTDKTHSKNHNRILDTKYQSFGINHIDPGCCPICGEYHCEKNFCKEHNFQQLIGYVNHLNLNPRTIGTLEIFGEFNKIRNSLYNLYWKENKSMPEIMKIFKYTSLGTLYKVFESFKIPRRDRSKSIWNAIKSGRFTLPKVSPKFGFSKNIHQEWHTTWTGESVFLRSSYELDYAKYLDKNSISYSVEDLKIEYFDTQLNRIRIAIPDFYLSDTNTIVEIKSDYTLNLQNLIDKFNAYKGLGYNVKLILEKEEVDLYKIEEEISEDRLLKIKNKKA